MNALQPNPDTGFLESINPSTPEAFTSVKKVKLLELAKVFADRREFPDVSQLCDAVGIKYWTFHQHLQRDEKFKDAWDEIKGRVFAGLTNELSVKAKSKNGIVANIAMLRYLESGTFNPESRIIHSTDNPSVKALSDRLSVYVDAEIVDTSENPSTPGQGIQKST